MLRLFLSAGLVFAAALLGADEPTLMTPQVFQERLKETRQPDFRRPGVTAAALRVKSKISIANAGMRDLSERIPATDNTIYPWFSVTKLFTAAAVMQLHEKGAIDLNAPLSKYLPEFKPDTSKYREPTVAHFLSHTSAVPSLGLTARFAAIHLASEPRPSNGDLLKKWVKPGEPLQFEPGSTFEYSNVGYLWLGELVARVSKEPYESYIDRHIIRPLMLKDTGFGAKDLQRSARGYARSGSISGILGALLGDERFDAGKVFGYRAIRHYEVDGPSYAGMFGTIPDMARFALCLLQGGELEGKRILKKESVAQMQQLRKDPTGKDLQAGFGWWIETGNGEKVVYQEGLGGGFKTQMRLYPERGYGVVVASNDAEYDTFEICRWVVSAPRN